MSLYLYAITHARTPVPPVTGIAGASVQQICQPPLAALVSPLATPRLAPTPEHLWQHEAVLAALLTEHALLPVRFGTALPDATAVQHTLQQHQSQLLADLERVQGCVELGLRVLWDVPAPTSPPAPTNSGHAYLQARLAEEHARRAWQQQAQTQIAALHAHLAPYSRDHRHRPLQTPRLLLTAAYLVAQAQLDPFRQAVAALDAATPTLQCVLTGPWAAYSFVSKLPTHHPLADTLHQP